MNGKTYPYLELAAMPEVGAALLDPRPAFVFRGDGTAILWTNAAGAAFLRDRVSAALDRRFAPTSAFARQLARLARLIPAGHPRIEILRFNLGPRTGTLPAACRRLNLVDVGPALLAIGQAPSKRESLATRAERLADAIATSECLVAVIAGDGRVLGASGGFDDLAPASAVIDALFEGVAATPARLLKRSITIEHSTRPAGIVRFTEGEQLLFLLIIGPAEAAEPATGASAALGSTPSEETERAQTGVVVGGEADETGQAEASGGPGEVAAPGQGDATSRTGDGVLTGTEAGGASEPAKLPPMPSDVQPTSVTVVSSTGTGEAQTPAATLLATATREAGPPQEVSPAASLRSIAETLPASPTTITFLWQTDRERRFTFVSKELAAVAGAAAAAILGRTWTDVAERFALDTDGRVAAHLAGQSSWQGEAVDWPVGDGRERIPVALSAIPLFDRDFQGFRGFGVARLDQRKGGPVIAAFDAGVEAKPSGPAHSTTAAPDAAEAPGGPPPLQENAFRKGVTAPASATDATPALARLIRLRLVGDEDIDNAARKSIEQSAEPAGPPNNPPKSETGPLTESADHRTVEAPSGQVAPAPAALAPPAAEAAMHPPPERDAAAASNVVRLPGAPIRVLPAERLSGTEQDAFRRIAEALGVKMPEGLRATEERQRTDASNGSGESSAEPDTRLLDKLPVGIVVYREHGIFFANRTLLDYLGYDTPEDFAKAGGAEAIFPDRGRGETTFPDAHGILTARRRDGGDLRVEARLHAVPWGAATALMLSLVKHDTPPEPVHDDELVEHLVVAERRIDELATILDTATDGIVVVDEHGRIENINQSAEALFGVETSAVLHQPFAELFAEESRKAALDYLDRLQRNGVASVLNDGREVIGKVPKGGLIPLFMTMGRLGSGAKFCAVLRDITHWKHVEEELIAARQAAETANAQKSEFLARISHEIRTPLNAIIGFSEVMMGERFGPIGNERYRDYLRDIHLSGEHLLSLINDLLDLSKIEAGKLELAFEAVAVNETIHECVALMQPQANRDRIIIRTSLSAGVPKVFADQRSLRQILLNLLSNAIKFTAAGGQVIVATALEENGEVVLRIRDTGIGMSEKDLETAMKPFRQVSTSGIRRGEGTGLGLPLTKALVEANRAAFSIDSAPNQGTLVKITFPTTRILAT